MVLQTMAAEQALDTATAFGGCRASVAERLIWQTADWRFLPQKWRQRLRKRFARPVRGPFDIIHDDLKFRLYPAENYCDRILFGRKKLPEQTEHDALLPLISPGVVFVDIGANIGSYSAFVGHHAGGNATLLAFEPHPRTHQKLLYNLKANGLPTDHVINAGIGASETVMTLWSDGGSNIGHTSLLTEGTSKAKIGVDVPVVTLLDTLNKYGIEKIDILKIDIEGFEDRALAPFLNHAPQELLPKHVLIEIAHQHLWEADLMAKLNELGYREQLATTDNRLFSC